MVESSTVTSISDLRPLMKGLTVHVKVLENAFISETGKKQVSECVVADSTASILLKARGKECEQITSGRSLEITGCKVDMYHGSMRLICDLEATNITEIDAVTAKKDVNMSLLEFESVVVSAYTKAEREAAENPPVAEMAEPQAVA